MPKRSGKIIRFVLRWTIAIVGIVWVVSNIHLNDRVRVLNDENWPVEVELLGGSEDARQFEYVDPRTGQSAVAPRGRVVNGPDRKTVTLRDGRVVPLLGMRLIGDINAKPIVQDLLIQDDQAKKGRFVTLGEVWNYALDVPQPRVEVGAKTMVRQADSRLLIGAVAVVPLTFLFTTIRWHRLLKVLGIVVPLSRCFVLNMVGAFYNTFMPGSTGGDVLKAYYAAKQAPTRRTAAVMSVIVDRAIGLLALIILGGSMAAIQYARAQDRQDPMSVRCLQVAIAAAVLLLGTLIGSTFVYWRGLRQALKLDALVARAPMQTHVQKIIEVVRLYRERPVLIFWAIIITFPVHLTVIVSAMLAGRAFGLPVAPGYYFIVVPVVVLVGALPLSPQGVGVMEAFAFYLTRGQGATVNQALALTMSIRLVAMIWNMTGGLFVLRGGYHTPSEKEQADLGADESETSKDKKQETNKNHNSILKSQAGAITPDVA
jgi:uncharacterized protein (TIRG00374 family)